MKSFATRPPVAFVLRAFGVDPDQYALLLDLFSKLSDRQEFEAGSARYSMRTVVGMFAVFSGLINLIAAFGPRPPVRSFILANFVFTTFLLLMILTMEAINTFLNPVEASVLVHQPVRDGSYFAAKLTYLALVVAYVVFPINLVPALVGLNLTDASWLHPATYLISAYLLGFFMALTGCGILGLLFRILPVARIRNTILWVQIGCFTALAVGPRLMRAFSGVGQSLHLASSAALPLNWFVVLAAPEFRSMKMFFSWPAIASMIVFGVIIAAGIRSLSAGYLARVHILLKSGPARRYARSGRIGTLVRLITGRPSGRAAFAFVYGMAKTDWQFRRTVYPMLIQLLVLPLIGLARGGLGHSPFTPGSPTVAHFLPHIAGLLGLSACFAITYSNQHKAAWIFLTFPADGIHSFVRGIFWALWLSLSALPLISFPLLIWNWGIADAALFTAYCLATGSLYLSIELFLVDGLPFASPPESMKGSMTAPLVFAALIGALILVGLQWLFIFQSKWVTAGVVLAFGGAAYVIAQHSLRYLEVNVLHTLHLIATGRTGLFKEVG